jgi:hypothetical protein
MKNLQTFDEFLNESMNEPINEGMIDAVAIAIQAVMMSMPAVALAVKNGAFDDWKNPVDAIKDWKRDRIVSGAVERLNKDPEILAFLNQPASKQRGKWKELIAKKLTDKEMKHINSISRYRVEDGKI